MFSGVVDHQPHRRFGRCPHSEPSPARDSTPAAPDSATRATALTIIRHSSGSIRHRRRYAFHPVSRRRW